ncbi:hypothetical protein SO802_026469 [Lithocarpus litseifolius]|uniref:MULE transposase domain-containing protein n=1 Tax=Lithocarpus litseifolius TaxID=425828 RepID=A0AAW2C2Z8_9ROSI
MIAMTTDANNKIYPLAFAVVKSESTETWGWFLACIRSNVNTRWESETLKNLVWRAASATQERKFNATFDLIENVNWDAYQYLKDVPKEKWTLTFDKGYRYGTMTTNISECFNGVLKGTRSLPITAMEKYTWFKLNSYFDDHRNKSIEQLNSGKKNGVICIRYRHDAKQYIDPCYNVDALFRSYAPVFPALKDRLSWPDPNETRKVLPNLIREKGRPVSTRIRNEMDEGGKRPRTTPWKEGGGQKVQCGLCDQEGHNRRICHKLNEAPTSGGLAD